MKAADTNFSFFDLIRLGIQTPIYRTRSVYFWRDLLL